MAKGKSFKRDKFEERILGEVNMILRSKISDARLQFVSITKVELNNDYSQALLYWDTFDAKSRGDAKTAIESIQGRVRSLLAQTLDVRHVPQITFKYDSQYESERAIEDLLNEQKDSGPKS